MIHGTQTDCFLVPLNILQAHIKLGSVCVYVCVRVSVLSHPCHLVKLPLSFVVQPQHEFNVFISSQ